MFRRIHLGQNQLMGAERSSNIRFTHLCFYLCPIEGAGKAGEGGGQDG